jgi:hypothetical protein
MEHKVMNTDDASKLVSASIFNNTAIKLKERECTIARIVDFSVTTDSVVAKAVVVTDKQTHFIEIEWGDGETSNIDINYASHFKIPAFNGDNALLPGTYEFYHRYDVTYVESIYSPDINHPAPMDYFVILKTIDFNGDLDLSIKEIRIEPSYRINFYQLSVGIKDQCDGGSPNEFTISQAENGDIKREWSWFPSDNFFYAFPTYRVPESQLSQVFTVTNTANPTNTSMSNIRFNFIEHDRWYDDRGSIAYPAFLREYLNGVEETASGKLEADFNISDANPWWGSSCTLMYAVEWELKLLVPFPSNQPTVFSQS